MSGWEKKRSQYPCVSEYSPMYQRELEHKQSERKAQEELASQALVTRKQQLTYPIHVPVSGESCLTHLT